MGTLPQGRVSGNRTHPETVAVSLKAKVVQRKQGNNRRAGSIPAVPTLEKYHTVPNAVCSPVSC